MNVIIAHNKFAYKIFFLLLIFRCIIHSSIAQQIQANGKSSNYAIVIHGGAGYMQALKEDTSQQQKYKTALLRALNIGIVY